MNSDSINPCDCCHAKDKASGCDGCVLNIIISKVNAKMTSAFVIMSVDACCRWMIPARLQPVIRTITETMIAVSV